MTIGLDLPQLTYLDGALPSVDTGRAANDDATAPRVPLSVGPGAWDPYEIWASRVRDPRAGRGTRSERGG